jgi:hypothetical protein
MTHSLHLNYRRAVFLMRVFAISGVLRPIIAELLRGQIFQTFEIFTKFLSIAEATLTLNDF